MTTEAELYGKSEEEFDEELVGGENMPCSEDDCGIRPCLCKGCKDDCFLCECAGCPDSKASDEARSFYLYSEAERIELETI